MVAKKKPTKPTKLIIDNSILQAWVTCRLMATLKYIFHLQPKATAAPLQCGTAVHEALAYWLNSGGEDIAGALDVFKGAYRTWAKKNHILPPHRLAYDNVALILANWFQRNTGKKWPFIHEEGLVEVALQYDLTNHITAVGVMDALRRAKVGKALFGIDHKTSGSINMWWENGQRFGSQYTGYDTMLYEMGYDELAGWYVNGIGLPELNSSTKTCPKHKMPYVKCRLAPEHLKHKLLLLTKTPGSRKDWLRTATEHAEDFALQKESITKLDQLKDLPRDGVFNRGTPCVNCDYQKWCHGGRQPHRLQEFEVRPWNPLDHIKGLQPAQEKAE